MRELSDRSLTRAYVIALAIIAVMSAASHLALDHILEQQDGSAVMINVSGRQRMLSQRIVGSAAELALGIAGSRETLVASLDTFERAHHDLLVGNASAGLPCIVMPEVKALYAEGAAPLNTAVADFIARGRRLSQLAPDAIRASPDLSAMVAAARAPLLKQLDDVVAVHQRLSEGRLGVFRWLETSTLIVVLITLICEALLIFRPMVTRIAGYTRALVTMASIDPLTEVANRRSLIEQTANRVRDAQRANRPLCMLMIDVDRFKSVNDTFGHAAGDAVLKTLCQTLIERMRPDDILGRLGGEEFCVILPFTTIAAATLRAEDLRQAVAALVVPVGDASIAFTISIGAAELTEADATFQTLLDRADRAVYRAKADGRNRVVVARQVAVPNAGGVDAEGLDEPWLKTA